MKRRRFLPWMIAAGLFLALVGGLRWITNLVDSKIPTSVPAAAHSTAISLEKSADRSRMFQADPTETRLSAKDNAANDYRHAFALIEKLTPRELAIINLKTPPQPPATDEEIAALLEKIAPIIAAFEAGAAKPGCDWGMRHLSFSTSVTGLVTAFNLSRIVLWDSTQRITDQPETVVRHLQKLHRLGNQIDVMIVGSSINSGIQGQISRFLTEQAARWTPETRSAYLAGTDSSALIDSFQKAMELEGLSLQSATEMLRDGRYFDGTPLTDEQRAVYLPANDPNKTLDPMENSRGLLDELRESLLWSDAQTEDWLRRNPSTAFIEGHRDVYLTARDNMRQQIVNQELVRAGVTILDQGPSALARFPDPITGQPFRYRITDAEGSFELQSNVLYKGKPVSLTFRRGEKATESAP